MFVGVDVLKQIDVLEQELIGLKRVVIHGLSVETKHGGMKSSLFGSVRGGDITEKMIADSKRDLFRSWKKNGKSAKRCLCS